MASIGFLKTAVLVCILFFHHTAFAIDEIHRPFYLRNETLLKRLFLFPVLELGSTLSKNTFQFTVATNTSSIIKIDSSNHPQESLILDAELNETYFVFRYGMVQNLELSFATSILHISDGGYFDVDIHNFHRFFGMPTGGRQLLPDFGFRTFYQKNHKTLIDDHHFDFGTHIPYYQIGLKYNLLNASKEHSLATKLSIKSSYNYNEALLIDNGKTDQSISLFHTKENCLDNSWLYCLQAFHAVKVGKATLIESIQKEAYHMYQVGYHVQLRHDFVIKNYFYAQSALYESKILALSETNVQIILGFTYKDGDHTFDFAFSEDISIAASPDITVQFAYNAVFY